MNHAHLRQAYIASRWRRDTVIVDGNDVIKLLLDQRSQRRNRKSQQRRQATPR